MAVPATVLQAANPLENREDRTKRRNIGAIPDIVPFPAEEASRTAITRIIHGQNERFAGEVKLTLHLHKPYTTSVPSAYREAASKPNA